MDSFPRFYRNWRNKGESVEILKKLKGKDRVLLNFGFENGTIRLYWLARNGIKHRARGCSQLLHARGA